MSDYKVTDTELTAVADAIRSKGGTEAQLEWSSGFVSAIGAISTGTTPTGNINITDMQSTDVSAYATAQVVDADLVAGNIKKDVNILGIVGTYEASGNNVNHEELTPLHFDINNGFVSSGTWYNSGSTSYSDVYSVTAGENYIIHLGGTVGSRFRVMLSTTDPALATGNIEGLSIVDESNPSKYEILTVNAKMVVPAFTGFLTIMKDNTGTTNLKTYVLKFNEQ